MEGVIYQFAGILGINPDTFTLRQLDLMVKGKGKFEWAQTANILALHLNLNRKKGAEMISPESLNPFSDENTKKKKVMLSSKDSMEILRKVFVKE